MKFPYSNHVTGGDNPALRGKPDSVLFNRHELYEVDYLVHQFCNETNRTSDYDRKLAKAIIKERLPAGSHTRRSVINWLNDNFSKYHLI